MGRPSASDEDVEKIAKKSGCYDFIMELESGFDTIVGGSGSHLSGGERQRISIARAMLKNAPILILDEATSYTDPENEAVMQRSISELSKGKTLIVIAHRLSTIIDADCNTQKVLWILRTRKQALILQHPCYRSFDCHLRSDQISGNLHCFRRIYFK